MQELGIVRKNGYKNGYQLLHWPLPSAYTESSLAWEIEILTMNDEIRWIVSEGAGVIGPLLIAIYAVWSKRDTRRAEAQKTTAEAYLEMVKGMAEMSKLVTTGNQQREEMLKRVNKLEDDLQAERGEKESLAKRVSELESAVDGSQAKIKELSQERDQLKKEIADVKADRVKFESAKEKEVGELLDKLNVMQSKLRELEAQIETMQVENKQLRAELSKYEHETTESPLAVVTLGGDEHSDSQESVGENPVHN